MFVLDTDHLNLLQWNVGVEGRTEARPHLEFFYPVSDCRPGSRILRSDRLTDPTLKGVFLQASPIRAVLSKARL